jgi:hypothetical protein
MESGEFLLGRHRLAQLVKLRQEFRPHFTLFYVMLTFTITSIKPSLQFFLHVFNGLILLAMEFIV